MFAQSPLPRSLEASFRDASSDKASVRESAIRDVVRHAHLDDATRDRATVVLERLLRDDLAPNVRAAAALALADLRASDALPSLLVAVEDDDGRVRQMALAALGEIGDPRASSRLRRALDDARPEVRYQAVIAFARVSATDPPEVATALSQALGDPDEAIRYIAMRVAEEFGEESAPLEDPRILARAEQIVSSPPVSVAVVAALYLTRLGREQGRALVLDVVAGRVRAHEPEDEQACVELCGEIGLVEAIPHLERRVWGRQRTVRALLSWGAGDRTSHAWHARIALARMGHARARQEILADLASRKRETCEAAVVAAGRARLSEAREAVERLRDTVDGGLVSEALVRLAVD